MSLNRFDKPEMEARKAPTKNAIEAMLIAHASCPGINYAGVKITCEKPLSECEEVHYDHIQALWAGGTNNPDNWQPLCSNCHRVKTDLEAAVRAKADRQGERKGQYARRKKRGGSSIQSRGFNKTYRRKVNGTVERVSE